MRADGEKETKGVYGSQWDNYVRTWGDSASGQLAWPGDEWGTPQTWERVFNWLFVPAEVASWKRAVEIGPGSGKYTLKVLESSPAEVRAYDISGRFLEVC